MKLIGKCFWYLALSGIWLAPQVDFAVLIKYCIEKLRNSLCYCVHEGRQKKKKVSKLLSTTTKVYTYIIFIHSKYFNNYCCNTPTECNVVIVYL